MSIWVQHVLLGWSQTGTKDDEDNKLMIGSIVWLAQLCAWAETA